MEKRPSTDAFVATLATRNRVLMVGGMAIIAHGLSRPTKGSVREFEAEGAPFSRDILAAWKEPV